MALWDLCQQKVIINLFDLLIVAFFSVSTGQYTEEGHCSAHSGEKRAAGGAQSQERWY